MTRRRYRLYLDESGDHQSIDAVNIGKRYLGLVGVIVEQPEIYADFCRGLETMLRDTLGTYDSDDPPLLHRVDILQARGPFKSLANPAKRNEFNVALLRLIRATQFRIIAVVIDKLTHRDKDYRALLHPYHYCLQAMLERYCGWLRFTGAVGDVMAESRKAVEDMALKTAYRGIYAGTGSHSRYLDAETAQRTLTSNELKIRPKEAGVEGLQLADLLANPLTRDVLMSFGRIGDVGGTFGAEVIATATPKYNKQEYQGRIQGYGRILLT